MHTDIASTVGSWPGIAVEPHRFGGQEFTLGGREVGHVHGARQVDIPFPKRVRNVLVDEGFTSKHHRYPDSGWVTKYVDSDEDAERAVWLLRIAYLSHVAALQRRTPVDDSIASVDVAAEIERLDLPGALHESLSPGGRDPNGTTTAAGR